jgi:FAD synthase
MHFGHKKTFSEPIATEIYFQEFIPNVELSEIELDIREKIRDIKKFVNIEELKKQIEADVKAFL